MTDKPKAKRGFAVLPPEVQREMASRGGKAVRPEQRHFAKDTQAASEAGRKGGSVRKNPLPVVEAEHDVECGLHCEPEESR